MLNPLIPEILKLLQQHPHGISEYEIFQGLGEHAAFSDIGESGQLPLFQKHFLIMNGLYQLQQNLWKEEQLILDISPLKIFLTSTNIDNNNSHPVISESAKLRTYYLDWCNLQETTEEDVVELHHAFWKQFNDYDGKDDALKILGVDDNSSNETIRLHYKKMAAAHHPDKGGCRHRFIEIRKAYELLKRVS